MFEKAEKILKENIKKTENKKELIELIKGGKMVRVPLCNQEYCEDILKSDTGGAKTLFIDSSEKMNNKKCIICNKSANYFVYVGKTY